MLNLSTAAPGKLLSFIPASLGGRERVNARMWGLGRADGDLSTVSTPPTTTATPDSFITYIKREKGCTHQTRRTWLGEIMKGIQLARKDILYSCLFDV